MAENEKGLVEYKSRDGQAIRLTFDTVRKYLVSGNSNLVTDQEIVFFMGACKARGLNPFKKDCYLIKYTERDNAAIVVSIDYYRSRARAQQDCRGWAAGIIVLGKEDEPIYRKGSILYKDETLLGGWFRGRPEKWDQPYEWTVELNRYVKRTKDGNVTQFWTPDKQPEMIAKVAESQGLRKLWPDEFQGLHIREEITETELDVTPPYKEPKEIASAETDGEAKKDGKADKKVAALAWVESAPEAEIMDPDNLTGKLKGLKQADQLDITRAYNQRKHEITEALKSDTASAR